MTPTPRHPWLLAFSILSIAITWLIYHAFTSDLAEAGSWGCEMSWMTPSYVEIPFEGSPMSRYRLFWYREQGWDKEEEPSGLPVIFIPGNAGSYSQVRSIASSASRQFYGETRGAEELPPGTQKLDFFTVDLNEEFSALHGPTLAQQAIYVTATIAHVRSLYPEAKKPPVILLGHSMGGIVARLAAISAQDEGAVSMVMTMATPHTISPAPVDYTTESIYARLAAHQRTRPAPLLVSVCGGISDTQVVSDTCALGSSDLHSGDGFTVYTSGLPGAWTAVDHQAMVWCHQIRWAVARALLEAGSLGTREARLERLKRWLSDEKADRSIAKGGGEKHRVEVTDRSMAVLVRWSSTEMPRISHCIPHKACREVEGKMSRVPWLKDEGRPFPLPGEGVHTDEVASVIEVQLEEATGHLEVKVPEVIAHGASMSVESIDGLVWRSDPEEQSPLRFLLRLPIKAASLLSYRLDYETPRCTGHSPVIVARYTCANLSETQIFAGSKRHRYLTNHIVSAPFISRHCAPDVELEITQDKACPVMSISASLAWGPSLAKAVMRYRMAGVTWGIGWLALACARTCSEGPISLRPAFAVAMQQSWKVFGLLVAGCAIQSLAWDLPLVSSLFVGERNILISVCFGLLLAAWTAGLAGMGIWAIEAVTNRQPKAASTAPAAASDKQGDAKIAPVSTASSPSYTLGFSQTLITLLLSLYLPHQLISLGLFVLIWRAVPRDVTTYRAMLIRTGAYLLTFSLPFNAVILPVWGRYIWADWKHVFPSEHNTLWLVPTLSFLLAVQYGRAKEAVIVAGRYVRWAPWGLACVTFGLGARYPVLVKTAIELVLLILSIDLCI